MPIKPKRPLIDDWNKRAGMAMATMAQCHALADTDTANKVMTALDTLIYCAGLDYTSKHTRKAIRKTLGLFFGIKDNGMAAKMAAAMEF